MHCLAPGHISFIRPIHHASFSDIVLISRLESGVKESVYVCVSERVCMCVYLRECVCVCI